MHRRFGAKARPYHPKGPTASLPFAKEGSGKGQVIRPTTGPTRRNRSQEVRTRLRCPGGARLSRNEIQHVQLMRNRGQLAKYDLRFMLNLKLAHDLTRHFGVSGAEDKLYVELGPGPGMLTRALLGRRCRAVLGVEVDSKYNPHLTQIEAETDGKFRWMNGDVLRLDEADAVDKLFPDLARRLRAAARQTSDPAMRREAEAERIRRQRDAVARNMSSADGGPQSWADVPPSAQVPAVLPESEGSLFADGWLADPKVELVANLPFNVADTCAVRLAVDCSRRENVFSFGRVPVHFFLQREVAQRAVAGAGSAAYNAFGAILQNYFRVAVRGTFEENTFFPAPEVAGALVTFEPRKRPLVDVDGSVLLNFATMILNRRARGRALRHSLNRFVPKEVADFMMRETAVDPDVEPMALAPPKVAQLALLWVRFLEASQQNSQGHAGWHGNRAWEEMGAEAPRDPRHAAAAEAAGLYAEAEKQDREAFGNVAEDASADDAFFDGADEAHDDAGASDDGAWGHGAESDGPASEAPNRFSVPRFEQLPSHLDRIEAARRGVHFSPPQLRMQTP